MAERTEIAAGQMDKNAGKAGSSSNGPPQRCDSHAPSGIEPRQPIDTSAVIRLVNLATDVPGRLLDISMGGCRIRTDRRFPVGIFRRVETEFRVDGLPFRLAGVTQAIYDPFNVGIRFVDMSERKREQLLQLIAELKEHNEAGERALHQPEPESCESSSGSEPA